MESRKSKLNILTIKPISDFQFPISASVQIGYYQLEGIKLWGLDLVKPDQPFDVTAFTTIAHTLIQEIQSRNKLPIIVGGTGFYIRSLLKPQASFGVPTNPQLRKNLELQSIESLQNQLKQLDLTKFNSMNHSDRNNPRRLIRAIEVAESRIQNPEFRIQKGIKGSLKMLSDQKFSIFNFQFSNNSQILNAKYQILHIGLTAPKEVLTERIQNRVLARIEAGAEAEVKALITKGYSWTLPSLSALGYKEWRQYLEGTITRSELINLWIRHEIQYAKRQLTWFRKEPNIQWLAIETENYIEKATEFVRQWVNELSAVRS